MQRLEQLGGRDYIWDEACFPLGQDSLLLGAFCTLRPHWRVCDLGCGAGALLALALEREPTLTVYGVEIDAHSADMARRNLPEATISTGDLTQRACLPAAGSCALALSNPPYFPAGSGGDGGGARMEGSCTVDSLCAAAAYVLKNGGRFGLVHRPERLCDLLCALRKNGLEPKRMQLVRVSGKPPSALLLEAVKQGKPGLEIETDGGGTTHTAPQEGE